MNTKQTEALKLALEALEIEESQTAYPGRWLTNAITAIREALAEQPAQQEPVVYDKTELNYFAQDLYDKKMREGKHGHYESMFHVIHQCIKKVAPPANANAGKPWRGLTDEEQEIASWTDGSFGAGARWADAKLREKNA